MSSGLNGNGHGEPLVRDVEARTPVRRKAPHVTVIVAGKGATQGQRILALVKAHKLTRHEAALLTDIPRSTFCHICNDAAPLNDERARRLADLFGVTVQFIRHGVDEPPAVTVAPPAAAPAPPAVTPQPNWRVMEVARLVDQCPPRMQRAILAMVRALVDTVHDEGGDE